jgi:hypothetical protein
MTLLTNRDPGTDPHGSALFLEAGSRSGSALNKEALEAQIPPWMAVNAHNGSLEAQNVALEGLKNSGLRYPSL